MRQHKQDKRSKMQDTALKKIQYNPSQKLIISKVG
jgi:hypothetical protein